MRKPVKCKVCKELRLHYAKGKCQQCWRRDYNREYWHRRKQRSRRKSA